LIEGRAFVSALAAGKCVDKKRLCPVQVWATSCLEAKQAETPRVAEKAMSV
jgi:hypothetical protein